MQFLNRLPCRALRPFVQSFWLLAEPANAEAHNADANSGQAETVVPDGCMEMIIHFGEPFQNQKAGEESYLQPRAFLGGQIVSALEIVPTGSIGMVGVRFQPWGAYHLLGIPMDALAQQTVDVEDIWGSKATHLTDMLADTPEHQGKFDLIEQFLLGLLPEIPEKSNAVREGINMIAQLRGDTSVPGLARQLHISQRTLNRNFRRQVGLSVKSFARIVRFQSVLHAIKGGSVSSLTDAAYYGGFFDQAHFVRDFRSFCGLNPGTFFREKRQFLDAADPEATAPASW